MATATHTTGSWSAHNVIVGGRDVVVYRRGDGVVMEVAGWRDYGALGRRLFTIWKPTQGREPGKVARAAIAKATGGQS